MEPNQELFQYRVITIYARTKCISQKIIWVILPRNMCHIDNPYVHRLYNPMTVDIIRLEGVGSQASVTVCLRQISSL